MLENKYTHNRHIAQRAVDASLPEWRKMPLCQKRGLSWKNWILVDIDMKELASLPVGFCWLCLSRLDREYPDWALELGLVHRKVDIVMPYEDEEKYVAAIRIADMMGCSLGHLLWCTMKEHLAEQAVNWWDVGGPREELRGYAKKFLRYELRNGRASG